MNYGQRYTSTFEKIYREIAHELSVPWIAFFMDGVAQNSNLMQNDGIHPNSNGVKVISKTLEKKIIPLIE